MFAPVDVLIAIGSAFVSWRLLVFYSKLKSVDNLPGLRPAVSPHSLPGIFLGLGLDFPWLRRSYLYKPFGIETISIVPWLMGKPLIFTSSLDVVRQIVATGGANSQWIKPVSPSQTLLLFGDNLAAKTGGDEWRKHRRIMGPAFNNKTYAQVWSETIRIYKEMVKTEGWDKNKTTEILSVQSFTFKFTLFVIASCGFGLPFSWAEPPKNDSGSMTLQEALEIVMNTTILRTVAPRWAYSMSEKVQRMDQAYKTLSGFMHEQIASRKAEVRAIQDNGGDLGRSDVFSRLVEASENAGGKLGLEDSELIGNTFVLLFAGHETSAHTLAATLGFLALYPEEQQKVYEQILAVVGNNDEPNFEDFNALDRVSAAFHEALRMFPAGSLMIREATEDVVLNLPMTNGGVRQTSLPKGATIVADVVGLEYNPQIYTDPETYKPSRWYANKEKEGATELDLESFSAFSVGPRACIGRKFATVESVAWLAMLLRDFKVDPIFEVNPKTGKPETAEEWRARVLQAKMVITLGVNSVPIRLTKRT